MAAQAAHTKVARRGPSESRSEIKRRGKDERPAGAMLKEERAAAAAPREGSQTCNVWKRNVKTNGALETRQQVRRRRALPGIIIN